MGNTESTGDASRDLYNAAKRGDVQTLQAMHRAGAGLEWRDAKGRTPLMVASKCVPQRVRRGAGGAA